MTQARQKATWEYTSATPDARYTETLGWKTTEHKGKPTLLDFLKPTTKGALTRRRKTAQGGAIPVALPSAADAGDMLGKCEELDVVDDENNLTTSSPGGQDEQTAFTIADPAGRPAAVTGKDPEKNFTPKIRTFTGRSPVIGARGSSMPFKS